MADTSVKEDKTAPSSLTKKQNSLLECHGDGSEGGVVKESQRTGTKTGSAPISFLEDLEREFEKQQKDNPLPLSPVKAGGPRPRTNPSKVRTCMFLLPVRASTTTRSALLISQCGKHTCTSQVQVPPEAALLFLLEKKSCLRALLLAFVLSL